MGDAYRIKGNTFRAHVAYLKENGLCDAVLARLSPEAAALVVQPPLPASWVSGALLDEICVAVHALKGKETLLQMERAVIWGPLTKMFIPILQGLFRVLGASPGALAARFQDVVKRHVEGMEFRYEPVSENSGTMTIRFATDRPVPAAAFTACYASMENIFLVCGVKGTVIGPEMVGPQSARFRMSW